MLSLQATSPIHWLQHVDHHLDELLIDHAHCEKKAAGTAMNLLFAYVDHLELTRAMTEIVNEELAHFHLVMEILQQRKIRFRKLPPGQYGQRLHALVRKLEPGRAVDRLLIAGLIEARSCERFSLLRDYLREKDPVLSEFYGSLFESEARHHSTYVRLAKEFTTEEKVKTRLEELALAEAEIICSGEPLPRMHS
jgi:tRNA-(ms[2]io[6]A)-hydroxylase